MLGEGRSWHGGDGAGTEALISGIRSPPSAGPAGSDERDLEVGQTRFEFFPTSLGLSFLLLEMGVKTCLRPVPQSQHP